MNDIPMVEVIAAARMDLYKWRNRHPQTLVLSVDTGYHRQYGVDPDEGHRKIGGLMFPVGKGERFSR
ncbi:MAG: DUF3179 domain-containing protein [Desulfobacteraceae bacterium]|nr:DUF3179 domain-containing protein [Desulfobacteraceae bacterium]